VVVVGTVGGTVVGTGVVVAWSMVVKRPPNAEAQAVVL